MDIIHTNLYILINIIIRVIQINFKFILKILHICILFLFKYLTIARILFGNFQAVQASTVDRLIQFPSELV